MENNLISSQSYSDNKYAILPVDTYSTNTKINDYVVLYFIVLSRTVIKKSGYDLYW